MSDLREKQLQEVEFRKKEIMEKYDVGEKVFNVKEWKKDDFYKKIIEDFEKENNVIVYLIVPDMFIKTIAFLYVNEYEEEWEDSRPSCYEDEMAYVYNSVCEDASEFGYVFINKIDGKLRRVG